MMKTTVTVFQQKGISLLEVLIALVVLSVGLLGLAQLQITGIKQNQDAWLRSQATNLTYDMLDRLRANRSAARGGNYTQLYANLPAQMACVNNAQALNVPANATQATRDLMEWNNMIACALPDGKGQVMHIGNNDFFVEIRWNEDRAENDAANDFVNYQYFSIRTEI